MSCLCLGTWMLLESNFQPCCYSHFKSMITNLREALRPPGNSTTFFQSVNSSACPVITVTSHISSISYLLNNHTLSWWPCFPFYWKNSCNEKKTSTSSHTTTKSPEVPWSSTFLLFLRKNCPHYQDQHLCRHPPHPLNVSPTVPHSPFLSDYSH